MDPNPRIGEINQRDRIGSLIQLYGVGHQDTLLTLNPEITMFHRDYKTHLGFGTHHVTVTRDSTNPVFLGTKETFSIPRQGTYLSNLTLSVVLNDTLIGNELFQANNQFGILELISEISFRVGNDVIDMLTPEMIVAEMSLFQSQDRWDKISQVIRGTITSRGIESMIPLPFWFCHWKPGFDNGSKFPLYPLDKQTPLEILVTWKTKEQAKCICSTQLTRNIELWVDLITCSPTEVNFLRTDPQESLVLTHEVATVDIKHREQRIEIPFRNMCKQVCWGLKQETDLVEYIQTMSETELDVRQRLSSVPRSVQDILEAHQFRMEYSRLLFQKNLLCNIQQKGFLRHHFTGHQTLHDYIDIKHPRLMAVHHTTNETNGYLQHVWNREGDVFTNEVFRNAPAQPGTLFMQAYGPSLAGMICDSRFYGTSVRRDQDDLVVSFRYHSSIPSSVFSYMPTGYLHPLCSIGIPPNDMLEIGIDRLQNIHARFRGRVYPTDIHVQTTYEWNLIEIRIQQTMVHIDSFQIPISMPMFQYYWIFIGNHSWNSVTAVRKARVESLLHPTPGYSWIPFPNGYLSEHRETERILAIAEHFLVTTHRIKHQTKEIFVFPSPLEISPCYAFQDSLQRLFLCHKRTILCVDTTGLVLYQGSPFALDIELAVYDAMSRSILCKIGTKIVRWYVDTMRLGNETPWQGLSALQTNLLCYRETPLVVQRDESRVYVSYDNATLEFEAQALDPLFMISSAVYQDILYVSTGRQVVSIEPLHETIKRYRRLDLPGGILEIVEIHVSDPDFLYLYCRVQGKLSPTGDDTTVETTLGIVRVRTLDLTIDPTFGKEGVQPLFSGVYEKHAPNFQLLRSVGIQESPTLDPILFKDRIIRVSDSRLTIDSVVSGVLPVYMDFPRDILNLSWCPYDRDFFFVGMSNHSVFYQKEDRSWVFDFMVDGNVQVAIDEDGVYFDGYFHSQHEDLQDFDSLVFCAPLQNQCYVIVYENASHQRYLAIRRLVGLNALRKWVIHDERDEQMRCHRVAEWDTIEEVAKVRISFLGNRVLFRYLDNIIGSLEFCPVPMYPPADFFRSGHLNLYDSTNIPFVSNGLVVVINQSSFVFHHSLAVVSRTQVFGGPHVLLHFQWFGESSPSVYIYHQDGLVVVAWIRASMVVARSPDVILREDGIYFDAVFPVSRSPSITIERTDNLPRVYPNPPKPRVVMTKEPLADEPLNLEIDVYIDGVQYRCSYDQGVVPRESTEYVYAASENVVLCKASSSDDQLVLRDIHGKTKDYPFYFRIPSDITPVSLYADIPNHMVYVRFFTDVRQFEIKTPGVLELYQGPSPRMIKTDDTWVAVGYYERSRTWSVISLSVPRRFPIPPKQVTEQVFKERENARFYRHHRSYVISDLMIAAQPMGKRERLVSLWKSTSREWIFEVYSLGFPVDLERLLGSETVCSFWDPFATDLQPLVQDVDLSGNRLYVRFSIPVEVSRLETTKDLSESLDLTIYIKHIVDSKELYYFALDTSTLQVLDTSGVIRQRFGIERIRSSAYPSEPYVQVVIDLANLSSVKIPVYNSLQFTKISMEHQLQLGEAILPARPRESMYFQTVVPFFTYQNQDSLGLQCYSFAVYPGYFQPSGHYNMTVTDNSLYVIMDRAIAGTMYLFGFNYNLIRHDTHAKVLFR